MYAKSESYSHSNDTILAIAGGTYTAVDLVIAKTGATLTSEVLKAGTIINSSGKDVNTSSTTTGETPADAVGIVLKDVDFSNSTGKEKVAVLIGGYVKSSAIQGSTIQSGVKTALKNVVFM